MPEVITLPPHLSFSQVGTMQKCSHRWFLERGLHLGGRGAWAPVGGSAAHSATEVWDRRMIEDGWNDTSAADLFNDAFDVAIEEAEETGGPRSEWHASGRASKEWPDKRNEKWWRHNGPIMVSRWMQWRSNSPWEIAYVADENGEATIGIELHCLVEIGGTPVKMYVDRLFEYNGSYMILDLKFGDHVPDDETQLATYRTGILAQYGVDAQWGCYWMGKDGSSTIPADLQSWSPERLEWLYWKTRQAQEQGMFLPTRSPLCGSCGVRDYCYAVGGPKADTVPAPWEVSVIQVTDGASPSAA